MSYDLFVNRKKSEGFRKECDTDPYQHYSVQIDFSPGGTVSALKADTAIKRLAVSHKQKHCIY